MRRMAAERHVSVAQIAIAWLLHQPVVSSVIIGAKRHDQLVDNIAAANVILTSEELRGLDEISPLAGGISRMDGRVSCAVSSGAAASAPARLQRAHRDLSKR